MANALNKRARSWNSPELLVRAQSLATVLVLESIDAVVTILLDYEHRFAEHEHEHD